MIALCWRRQRVTGLVVVTYAAFAARTCLCQPMIWEADLPSFYTPGHSQSFEIGISGARDLGAYGIELVLSSVSGRAGEDFLFDADATEPASDGYVFPSIEYFFDTALADSQTTHRIVLTDFDVAGVDTVAGINDRVATVAFRTAPDFSDILELSVDTSSLILDTANVAPTSIDGFAELIHSLDSRELWLIRPVPEPHGAHLGIITFAALGGFVRTVRGSARVKLNRPLNVQSLVT